MQKFILLSMLLLTSTITQAKDLRIAVPTGTIIIPDSSQEHSGTMRTYNEIFVRSHATAAALATTDPDPKGETPASIACVSSPVKHTILK